MSLLCIEIAGAVGIKGKDHILTGGVIGRNFAGDGVIQTLCAGKAQGTVHEVLLVVYHKQQFFHGAHRPFSVFGCRNPLSGSGRISVCSIICPLGRNCNHSCGAGCRSQRCPSGLSIQAGTCAPSYSTVSGKTAGRRSFSKQG